MKIIEEIKLPDSEGKLRIYCDIQCDICNKIFRRQKRFIKHNFCSMKCKYQSEGVRKVLKCAVCNSVFTRSNSKMQNAKNNIHFCSRKCKDIGQSTIKEIQPSHYGTENGSNYRSKAFKHYLPICNRCGFSNVIALEVHHKDRNRQNDDIGNLEILCCNCHTIEHLGC